MRIARSQANADVAAILWITRSTDESLINSLLCLPAKVVVNTCDDDDELVARIGCTSYQARVVSSLSRLHMPNNEATTVPARPFTEWILKVAKNTGGYIAQGLDHLWRPAFISQEFRICIGIGPLDTLAFVNPLIIVLRIGINQRNACSHPRVDRDHHLSDNITQITRIAENHGDLSRFFLHLLTRWNFGHVGKA
uniref:Putative endonuclease n=1 Tax=Aeromonas hydrophila TaxID=644 RepID=Q6TP07_AERHY|nr:putative endonuclease [Aeromonas hydrophila]